jgi:sigma-B regulation protein RsbU (phosphoserine phosphatase)
MIIENHLMGEVIENMEYMVRVMDVKDEVVFMNKKMKMEFGDFTCKHCFKAMGKDSKCEECISLKCQETGKPESKNVSFGEKIYRIIASPVRLANGEIYSIEIFNDISREKEMEKELLKQYDKMKSDIEFAKHVQKRALPIDGIYFDKIQLNSIYCPSEELGGDIFDVVKIDQDNFIIYMADVSGHGIKSSLITMFLRQILRGLKENGLDLNDAIDEMTKSFNDLRLGDDKYFSIIIGLYNSKSMELKLLNAGHNCLPIIISKAKGAEEIQIFGLPVCSISNKSKHNTQTIQIKKGDQLVLYTDGISEAFNKRRKEYLGSESIMSLLDENRGESGAQIASRIMARALDFSSSSLIDDAAILVAEIL